MLRQSGEVEFMRHKNEKLQIHIGENLPEIGNRFVAAWHGLGKGIRVRERHLSFESLEILLSLLTPKRWELLKHVHAHPARSIRALSAALRRDYRGVHEDVTALSDAGLLEREGRMLRADYDAIDSSFRFENGEESKRRSASA
jgi:predicted transcriptional regulator